MVLDESPSDPDPYFYSSSSDLPSSSEARKPQFDVSKLPQPIPLASLWGYSQGRMQHSIAKELDKASQHVKRPLKRNEIDALSYSMARSIRYASMGFPVGLIGGSYRAASTYEEVRFPFQRFFKNMPWAYSGKTLTYAGKELLRGQSAALAVHTLRATLYGGIGCIIGTVFFQVTQPQ